MRVKKSGSIESNTLCRTGKFNTTLGLCRVRRVARYFSDPLEGSEADGAAALRADSDACFLRHSLTLCPALPQKRQRLPSRRRFRSSGVSLPSLPSLSERSTFFGAGFDEEALEEGALPPEVDLGLLEGLRCDLLKVPGVLPLAWAALAEVFGF